MPEKHRQSERDGAQSGGGSAAAPLSRRRLLLPAAVCGTAGLLAWVFWVWALRGDPGQDWMVFYTAAQAWRDGDLPLVFDGERLTAAINARFTGWLDFPLNLHPWVYPPTFLLLFLPFGMLPPAVSLAVFLLSGFALALAAASFYLELGWPRLIALFSLGLCPAVPLNVMTGQNAFFMAAVLVGGFGLVSRAPLLGGALLGLISIKPQLALMVPVALVAARQWRALAGMGAAALLLAMLSLAVFGPEIWRAWLALVGGMNEGYNAWVANGRLNGASVFACLAALGLPHRMASLGQALAVAVAAASVYVAFRRTGPETLRLAVLLAATLLAAPHASGSDAVLLALATSLYIAAPRVEPLRSSQLALAVAVWAGTLFNPPSVFRSGVVGPVLILLLVGALLAELRGAGRRRPGTA